MTPSQKNLCVAGITLGPIVLLVLGVVLVVAFSNSPQERPGDGTPPPAEPEAAESGED